MTGALSRAQEQEVLAENERLKNQKAAGVAKKKAGGLSVSSWLGAGVGGALVGYLVQKNPVLEALLGGRAHIEHIIGLIGVFAEWKGKGKIAAAISGAGQGAVYSIMNRRGRAMAAGA